MASAYAEALKAGLAIVVKRRLSATEIEAVTVIGEVDGKNVILVDDLTETAGTLVGAARILRDQGARDIYAGVSHAVLTDLAVERLKSSEIKELITTDSVPVRTDVDSRVKVLSVAELLDEGIRRIHDDESVSSLFDIKTKGLNHGQSGQTLCSSPPRSWAQCGGQSSRPRGDSRCHLRRQGRCHKSRSR
jgi:ribose-phosphate pyrophosphokinase